eukprot:1183119-Prorocentrum_minimum.AAC.1
MPRGVSVGNNVRAGGVHVPGAGPPTGNVNAGGVHVSGAGGARPGVGPPTRNVNAGGVHALGAGPPTGNVNAARPTEGRQYGRALSAQRNGAAECSRGLYG